MPTGIYERSQEQKNRLRINSLGRKQSEEATKTAMKNKPFARTEIKPLKKKRR